MHRRARRYSAELRPHVRPLHPRRAVHQARKGAGGGAVRVGGARRHGRGAAAAACRAALAATVDVARSTDG
eukprot:2832476-Prymnesium_polylepis.1